MNWQPSSADRVDSLAGELVHTEAKIGMPVSARPRLNAKRLDLVDLLKVADRMDCPRSQHAPPFSHGVVDPVDFETDRLFGGDRSDLSIVFRAEDDVIAQHLEVDRKGHWPPGRTEDHSTYSTYSVAIPARSAT